MWAARRWTSLPWYSVIPLVVVFGLALGCAWRMRTPSGVSWPLSLVDSLKGLGVCWALSALQLVGLAAAYVLEHYVCVCEWALQAVRWCFSLISLHGIMIQCVEAIHKLILEALALSKKMSLSTARLAWGFVWQPRRIVPS